MKSWTKPTSDLVSRALASAVDYEQRRYFFSRLQNPLWAKPLAEHGCFATPPAIRQLGDGYIQIPPWPESQYLARVAKEAPQDIAAIAHKIPATDNPRVQDDIIDIALAIEDGQLSATLFSQVDCFAETSFTRWSTDKFGKLISHWANRGATEAALKLAKTIIRWRPAPRAPEKDGIANDESDNLFVDREPGPVCDESRYQELLTAIATPLTRAAPLETIQMLIHTLSAALKLSRLESDLEPGYDGSHYWCRRIDIADEYESSPRSHLAHALAQACVVFLEVTPSRFGELDAFLRDQEWKVFSRIRWHIYSRSPTLARDAMRQDILTAESYVDGDYDYEFVVMLSTAADHKLLSREELQGVFDQILKGPDPVQYRERCVSAMGREPSEVEIQSHREYLYLRQMFPFKAALAEFPNLWQRYQQALQGKKERTAEDYCAIGRPETYEVVSRSPITVKEIEGQSDDEVIRYLNTWKPPKNGYEEPSVSGLSGAFATAVKRNPDRFLRLTGRLKLREPTYIRDFLYFCSERAQKQEPLPWEGICELGQWVVGHDPRVAEPRTLAPATDDFANVDWTSSREALARLLSLGSGDYAEALPFALRSRAFEIIRNLATEFDPRLEGEATDESHERDLINRALNSVRGEAMHTLIDHALWIRRHLKKSGKASVSIRDMPEVRELLEARLDVNNEPSRAVRSVYGRFTPWLWDLDAEWFRQVSNRIFPGSESLNAYWLAAWNTYVRFIHPGALMFDALKANYKRAVERIGKSPESEIEREVTEGLGRHLIRFYWWGQIDLSGPDSILEKFLSEANPKQRANVMNHVGRSLQKSDNVPSEITQRLKAYWSSRLAAAMNASKRDEFSQELCEFAWWYKSGKFGEDWCLQQVAHYLDLVTKLDDSTFLIESLAESSMRHPKESALCFLRAIQKMSQQQYFYVREEEGKRILRAALLSEDSGVREIGERALDLLLRLGRFEFKNIATG